MKAAYPIILTPAEGGFVVFVPDFGINTCGDDLADAIEMARDAIGLAGIDMEDEKDTIPMPTALSCIKPDATNAIVSLVDVDFKEYRRNHDERMVRRNITLPAWMAAAASAEKINVSRITQTALKDLLR